MNILFLTLVAFDSLQEKGIYTDLLRAFANDGHRVCAISPAEKRQNIQTHLIREDRARILRLQIGNTQKTNIIEKGISTVMIEPEFKNAIKRYFSDIRFDLVLYSTPPITLVSAIEYVKKRDGAKSYLLLKDIFPQNALDIGMMSTSGPKGVLYRHFRNQEKRLYSISDRIGCMSPANVQYVKEHNPGINPEIVEVCPNAIEVADRSVDEETRKQIRGKYGLPPDKRIFVYGGNLGKPQDIPFVIQCLRACTEVEGAFFLIVGDGTEYGMLENYMESDHPGNVKLMRRIPKEDYDTMIGSCDAGLIFLDHRFTIPNFPSRLLGYMQAKLPVLACTDPVTDVGKVITGGEFGWWCESNDPQNFRKMVMECVTLGSQEIIRLKENAFHYLMTRFNVENAAKVILRSKE